MSRESAPEKKQIETKTKTKTQTKKKSSETMAKNGPFWTLLHSQFSFSIASFAVSCFPARVSSLASLSLNPTSCSYFLLAISSALALS